MENKDLISRKALIDWFMPYVHSGIETIPAETVIEGIKGAPAVEAAPVVHGQWKQYQDTDEWTCSVCGEGQVCYDYEPQEMGLNYCPNCGAKMDGGNNNG